MSIDLVPQFPGQLGFTPCTSRLAAHAAYSRLISDGSRCRRRPSSVVLMPPTLVPSTPTSPGHSSPRGAGRVVAERAAPGDALGLRRGLSEETPLLDVPPQSPASLGPVVVRPRQSVDPRETLGPRSRSTSFHIRLFPLWLNWYS